MSFFDEGDPEPGVRMAMAHRRPAPLAAMSPDWPCRHYPGSRHGLPPRLVGFLYALLRDGAESPGDVEQLAINVRDIRPAPGTVYTNPHLESYARSLAGYMLNQEEHPVKPSIGRIVIYRSRTGNYDVPAIINCTTDTIYPPGVEAGYVPALSSDQHVHLTVCSPGKPGMRKDADDFKVESEHGRSENVSGTYQEWDIALHDPTVEAEGPQPGTWRWPERV
jgi:hypothetical protein